MYFDETKHKKYLGVSTVDLLQVKKIFSILKALLVKTCRLISTVMSFEQESIGSKLWVYPLFNVNKKAISFPTLRGGQKSDFFVVPKVPSVLHPLTKEGGQKCHSVRI